MAEQTANKNLRSAKTDKKNEFYTQPLDKQKIIEN